MNKSLLTLAFAVAVLLGCAGIYYLFDSMLVTNGPHAVPAMAGAAPAARASDVVFNPPRPEDAPKDIRDAVMLGYHILMETQKYAPDYVGNDLQCRSCHFNAGRERNTLSLVGVAATYPKYRARHDYATDLVTRTQGCFKRSMNGKALPPEGKLMQSIMAYYHWISKGVPQYAKVPWLGLKKIKSDHKPDKAAGQAVFRDVCARCHGQDGLGTDIAPPVWGPRSFNDGAGMSKMKNFPSFVHHFMPKNNPTLTVEQALDVGAYATSQPRPHFQP